MDHSLSPQEIESLLAAAAPELAAGRLGRSVARGVLSPAERAVAEELLRSMLTDAALKVRQAISDVLKDSPHLPHDIAQVLAGDVEEVALPVLQFSAVLTDEDLIAAIRSGLPGKQVAVASRAAVTSEVAGELLSTDNNQAVAALVSNPGAALDAAQLETAVTRFGSDAMVAETLRARPSLSPELAARLRQFTTDTLIDYLMRRPDLPEEVITALVLKTREEAPVALDAERSPALEAVELTRYLHATRRLSPSLVLRALCIGDLDLVEGALAARAGIPIAAARTLLHDGGPLGLGSLHERAGLPPHYLPAFRVGLEVAHETSLDGMPFDRERYRVTMIERILTQFSDLDEADLDYLLIRLKEFDGDAANA